MNESIFVVERRYCKHIRGGVSTFFAVAVPTCRAIRTEELVGSRNWDRKEVSRVGPGSLENLVDLCDTLRGVRRGGGHRVRGGAGCSRTTGQESYQASEHALRADRRACEGKVSAGLSTCRGLEKPGSLPSIGIGLLEDVSLARCDASAATSDTTSCCSTCYA